MNNKIQYKYNNYYNEQCVILYLSHFIPIKNIILVLLYSFFE